MQRVPVVDQTGKPLMPTTPNRAASWVKTRKATPFWNRGVWCVRLNVEPSARYKQDIVVGIDPGSMKEGFTVKSESATYLNIQADAITDVKRKMELRRNARRARRGRKSPYRKNKLNRSKNKNAFSPSTRSRWDIKIRILKWLKRIYPVNVVIAEDIYAPKKVGDKRWNKSFSSLEIGKKWFYKNIIDMGMKLETIKGHETANLRKIHNLEKSKSKLLDIFSAHCVDSWVIANYIVGGHTKPDNTKIIFIRPLRWFRRQIHVLTPTKKGFRRKLGSTRSEGFERGSLIKHPKYGIAVVGGASRGRISLHSKDSYKLISRVVYPNSVKFICYLPWVTRMS